MTPLDIGTGYRALGLALGILAAVAVTSGGAAEDRTRLTLALERPGAGASAGDLAFRAFERELAGELCRRMAIECTILEVDRDRVVAGLLAGTTDAAMAALPITPASAEILGFSEPYAVPRHGFAIARSGPFADLPGTGKSLSFKIAPGDAQAAIAALRETLQGRRIGAATRTADLEFLHQHFGDVASVNGYPTSDAAARDLLQGRLDAVMAPTTELAAPGARPGFQKLVRAGPEFGQDDRFGQGIAVALRKSDTVLRDRFSRAVDGMIGDGSLRALSLRWFAIDITPRQCACKPF